MVPRKNVTLSNELSPSLFTSSVKSNTWLNVNFFFRCNGAQCNMCTFAKKTKIFPINHNCKRFESNTFLNCDSKYAIYIIHCNECSLCYVGCTIRKIKMRISEHLLAISKNQITSLRSCITFHFSTSW